MDISIITGILSDLGFLGLCGLLLFVVFKMIEKHDEREREMLETLAKIELNHNQAENKMVNALENNTRVMETFISTITKGE